VAVEKRRKSVRILWTFEAPAKILAPPQVAGDTIIFGGADGFLYGIGED
jgi:hypothetical protein